MMTTKTLFYTFLQTKEQEENSDPSDPNYSLFPKEIEIRPIISVPWEIIQKLTIDEVFASGKLKLPMAKIRNTMLRDVPENVIALTYSQICQTSVSVKDLDTDTIHEVKLWKFPHHNYFAMCESWMKDFVQRRRLLYGMVIGMYWNFETHMFCFSVLEGRE